MGPEHFWSGGWWIFPFVMPIVMVIVLVAVIYLVFALTGLRPPWSNGAQWRSRHAEHSETAIEVLKKRYARGEISREEFERIKNDLRD